MYLLTQAQFDRLDILTVIRIGKTGTNRRISKGGKKYIHLKEGKRLVRHGSRGGRYYMKGGNKMYIKE